jgi:hypothetical protein
VDERRPRRVGRQPLDEPRGEGVHLRHLARLRAVPALGPAAHLPPDEPGRLPQPDEPVRLDVDGVEVGERVHQRAARAPARRGPAVEFGRLLRADDEAAPALHEVEGRADDRGVPAEHERARREPVDRVDGLQDVELARHVVRARRHGAERRPAHHELLSAEAQQVSQVRVSARELLDRHRRRRVEAFAQRGA